MREIPRELMGLKLKEHAFYILAALCKQEQFKYNTDIELDPMYYLDLRQDEELVMWTEGHTGKLKFRIELPSQRPTLTKKFWEDNK